MQFVIKWKPFYNADAVGMMVVFSKRSDAGKTAMFLTDEFGNRYDFIDLGGAASQDVYFSGRAIHTGWYLFEPSKNGTKSFVFHDSDQRRQSPQIELRRGTNLDAPFDYLAAPPPPPPNTGKIGFVSENFSIFVMNADGTNKHQLTENLLRCDGISFSPDGAKIAYDVTSDQNHTDIIVMNLDGSNKIRLTGNASRNVDPSWSPDGKQIVFTSFRDGNSEIYIMNSDGSDVRKLTNDPSEDWQPVWSPNGSKIAFTSNRTGNLGIFLMNTDGSSITKISPYERCQQPSWSPDGGRLAFTSSTNNIKQIFTMSPNGNNVLLVGTGELPAWSPDGDSIAHFDAFDLLIMNTDGSNVVKKNTEPQVFNKIAWGKGPSIELPDAPPQISTTPPILPPYLKGNETVTIAFYARDAAGMPGDAYTGIIVTYMGERYFIRGSFPGNNPMLITIDKGSSLSIDLVVGKSKPGSSYIYKVDTSFFSTSTRTGPVSISTTWDNNIEDTSCVAVFGMRRIH